MTYPTSPLVREVISLLAPREAESLSSPPSSVKSRPSLAMRTLGDLMSLRPYGKRDKNLLALSNGSTTWEASDPS